MDFKCFVFCASAFLIQLQSIAGQRCPPSCCSPVPVSDNGGPLPISSLSPIAVSGIAIATDLGLSGNIDLSGEVPYMSAVAFEGKFDTSGSVAVSYGCGDCVAITTANPSNVASVSNCGNQAIGCRNLAAATSALAGDRDRASCLSAAAERYGAQNRYTARCASGAAGVDDARCADCAGAGPTVAATAARTGQVGAIAANTEERQRAVAVVAGATAQRLAQDGLLTGQQSIYGQRSGYSPSSSCGCSGSSSYGSSLSSNSIVIPSSGGAFPVTSIGPISPSGISVASDIGLAGNLDVCGQLPFLSAVAFQDNFDTTGSGSVSYGCGDGCIAINNVIGGSSGSGCGCIC